MTATPSDAIHLLGDVIFPPLPSSLVCFTSESLDHVGRMTTAYVVSFPPLGRRLGSFGSSGGGRQLSLESFRFCACLHSVSSISSGLRRSSSGGCIASPLVVGGYFAAVLLWRMLYHHLHVGSLQANALPPWSGECFTTFDVLIDLCTLDVIVYFSRFSCMMVSRFEGWCVSPPLLFLLLGSPTYCLVELCFRLIVSA
jgi:hypothetical protein